MALPPNVQASVGSVDDAVANLMIIFLVAASTVTLGSSSKLGLATAAALPSAAAAAVAAPAAATLNDVIANILVYLVTVTTGSLSFAVVKIFIEQKQERKKVRTGSVKVRLHP